MLFTSPFLFTLCFFLSPLLHYPPIIQSLSIRVFIWRARRKLRMLGVGVHRVRVVYVLVTLRSHLQERPIVASGGVWIGVEKGAGWSNLSWQIDRLANTALLSYEIADLVQDQERPLGGFSPYTMYFIRALLTVTKNTSMGSLKIPANFLRRQELSNIHSINKECYRDLKVFDDGAL